MIMVLLCLCFPNYNILMIPGFTILTCVTFYLFMGMMAPYGMFLQCFVSIAFIFYLYSRLQHEFDLRDLNASQLSENLALIHSSFDILNGWRPYIFGTLSLPLSSVVTHYLQTNFPILF